MSDAVIVNSIGLGLDIVGVTLIFLFGLPDPFGPVGGEYVWSSISPEGKKRRQLYQRRGRLGILFLGGGFVNQLWSIFLAV